MMRTLLVRGMIAGLVAGALAFLWAHFVGEPPVRAAIAVEEAAAAAADPGAAEEAPVVTRSVQETWGLGVGVLVFSVAIGGFLSLVFGIAYGRASRLRARATVAAICGLGFLATVLVPLTKYPANPPAVGSGDTINERTEWFFVLIIIALVAVVAAVRLGRQVAVRWGAGNGLTAGAVLFALLIAVAHLALPAQNEVRAGFPPQILWDFRLANLGTQAILWATLAFGFGLAAERAVEGRPAWARRPAGDAAPETV
ncbi:CbtA family protein [Patulibacter sp. SYSU D01012]|uniref:CbtA family protein n=1 Tax=Patulibacter sp. SYSU D01012 TaxID=2817381 RepID=UPI001B3066E3|nr:CbtA family protein [Patulibacter sp. SYSU D01012]